jgi:hypothetical protein
LRNQLVIVAVRADVSCLSDAVRIIGRAVMGGEVQRRMNRKTIHITQTHSKVGSMRSYEREIAPTWAVGDTVKLDAAAMR